MLPRIAGFNTNVRIYSTQDPVIAVELSYGIDQVFDRERYKRVLLDALVRVKHCLDQAPTQLTVWPGPPSRASGSVDSLHREGSMWDGVSAQQQGAGLSPERRRYIACEVQKANIYASLLSSRSYYLEKHRSLSSLQDIDVRAFAAERESIADDLLNVLSSIRPVHMEPNAVSLCMKIRQVASTLLPEDGTASDVSGADMDGGAGGLSGRAEGYLRAFLEILMDLEKCGTGRGEEGEEDAQEEMELRRWADLREYQKEVFGASGL